MSVMFGSLRNRSHLPPAGAAARIVRACGRLRAVRRQRGGRDRHAVASGGSSDLAFNCCWKVFSRGKLGFNSVPLFSGGGERAEHWKVQQHGEPGCLFPVQVGAGGSGEHERHFRRHVDLLLRAPYWCPRL